MFKLGYAVLLAVCGAVLVHIAIIFLIPRLGDTKMLTQLETLAQTRDPLIFSGAEAPQALPGLNPFFRYRVCFYDLEEGTFQLMSTGDVPFFSASLLSRNGDVLFSITDRQTINRTLNIEVRPSAEQQRLSQTPEETSAVSGTVPVYVQQSRGLVVVRAFVPDKSWDDIANEFLKNVICQLE
jgi:uncharacterized membrane protein